MTDDLYKSLKGVIVPILTPLDENENIDSESTARLVEYLLKGGVNGLFVLGTTGEYIRLSDEQRDKFVDICAEQINGRKIFSVNVSDMGTAKILRNIKVAQKYSPDFIAVGLPPYFLIDTVDEQYEFFKHIAESTDLPVMIYNIPCCTGGYIKPECIEKLLKHKNIIGIKDSSGNLDYLADIAKLTEGADFSIFNGHENFMYEAFEIGAKGIISSSANVFPSQVAALYNAYLEKDVTGWDKYYPILRQLDQTKRNFNDNIYGIYMLKYILAKKRICTAAVTKPFLITEARNTNIDNFCDKFLTD